MRPVSQGTRLTSLRRRRQLRTFETWNQQGLPLPSTSVAASSGGASASSRRRPLPSSLLPLRGDHHGQTKGGRFLTVSANEEKKNVPQSTQIEAQHRQQSTQLSPLKNHMLKAHNNRKKSFSINHNGHHLDRRRGHQQLQQHTAKNLQPHNSPFFRNKEESLRFLRLKTTALLGTPIGSWTSTRQWSDAEQVLRMWTQGSDAAAAIPTKATSRRQQVRKQLQQKQQQQQHSGKDGQQFLFSKTSESVLSSFQLLERVLLELRRSRIGGTAGIVGNNGTTATSASAAASKISSLQDALVEWTINIDTSTLDAVILNWSCVWQDLHQHQGKQKGRQKATTETRNGDNSNQTAEVSVLDIGDASSSTKVLLEWTPDIVLSRLDPYKARSSGRLEPSLVAYEAILAAAAASKTPRVGVNILDRLRRGTKEDMLSNSSSNNNGNMSLNSNVYDRFFRICASKKDASQAEAILEHMYQQYKDSQDTNLRPHTRHFHQILVALVRDHDGDLRHAKDKSLNLLQRMKDLSVPGGALEGAATPDRFSYNLVLRCLSQWLVSSLHGDLGSIDFALLKDYQSNGDIAMSLLNEMKARGEHLAPDHVTYGLVMSILMHLAKAELVESLLEQMYKDFRANKKKGVEPDTGLFNSVLAAWTKYQREYRATTTTVETSGGRGGKDYSGKISERVEGILRKMEGLHRSGELKNCKPNGASYRHVIQCWADSRTPEAGDRAMAILREAQQIQKETGRKMLVGASYAFVVKAYAGDGQAAKAEDAVAEFHRLYLEEGIKEAKPSNLQLSFLISAWAKAKHPDAPRRAKLILEEFQKLYDSGQVDHPPDVASFNSVMECYSKSDHPRAAADAEELLLEMKRRARNGENHLTPHYLSYFHVMKVYAKSGNTSKAEDLFEDMLEGYRRGGDNSNQMHEKVLHCVIEAYVNSAAPDAPQRAVAFLQRTEKLYDKGRIPCKANVVGYTLALKCLAASSNRDPDKGQQMESLINEMEERASKGDAGVAPNTMTYSTVIQHYGRVGQPEKAEALLERMYQRYQGGNQEAKPNKRTFTSVLLAWSRSDHDNPAERALAILDWMKKLDKSGVLDDIKPNRINYTAVLYSIARARDQEVNGQDPRRLVLSLLDEMEEQAAAGDEDSRPNIVAYNSALHTYSNRGDGLGAQELLARMVHNQQRGLLLEKPDIVSWNSVLDAWSNSMDRAAVHRAEAVLDRINTLHKSGELKDPPNSFTYTCMINVWLKSELPEASKRIASLLDELDHVAETSIDDDSISMYDQYNLIRNLCKTEDFDLYIRAERVLRQMIRHESARNEARNTNSVIASFKVLIKTWKNSKFRLAAEHADGLQRELDALGFEFSKRR